MEGKYMNFLIGVGRGINDNVIVPAYNIGGMVKEGATDLCMSIDLGIKEGFESFLPRPIAIVAHNALRSLPVTLAYMYMPLPYRVGLWATYVVIHFVKPSLMTCTAAHYLHKSIAVAAAMEVIWELYRVLSGLILKNTIEDLTLHTVSALGAIVMSATFFGGSRQFVPGVAREVPGHLPPLPAHIPVAVLA
jgi:hypothetical protein